MFDPEINFDARLGAEFGLKPGVIVPFLPKIKTEEQELKYSTDAFTKIRDAINNANNRLVDTSALVVNPYVLVTLNLDTADRQLAKAGYSLRVRFAYDGDNRVKPISSIDMCIKTTLVSGNIVKLVDQTRGEWETELHDLKPNMAAMIEEHEFNQERPLPDFFKDGHIKDDQYFVESIGCTMRNVFPSYEKFERRGKTVLTAFQHTEDWQNIFLTPHGDTITSHDSEAECEFLGFYNLTPDDVTAADFEKLMRKSMKLMDRVIIGADMVNIKHNTVTKSMRARNGLETVYAAPTEHGNIKAQFDIASRINEASLFSLSQRVRPQNVPLDNIWHHSASMKAQMERMISPAKVKDDNLSSLEYKLL